MVKNNEVNLRNEKERKEFHDQKPSFTKISRTIHFLIEESHGFYASLVPCRGCNKLYENEHSDMTSSPVPFAVSLLSLSSLSSLSSSSSSSSLSSLSSFYKGSSVPG